MHVLFICKFNKVRSKLAEAFFNKYATKHKAKSAGIIKGSAVDDKVKNIASRHGIKVGGKSKNITVPLLRWYDIMVIVANDVPLSLFSKDSKKYGKKVIKWNIEDRSEVNLRESDKMANEIENKVKKLIQKLQLSPVR